ncbi:SpoIIE family protein phosphatase [Actinomadura sp. NPDC048394]|uniref:SpoIIE family protein phosphatase n=1 Tax=Actinomadura sp. NPDC048394 TaxID=3158223 RepID=UPI0033E138FE
MAARVSASGCWDNSWTRRTRYRPGDRVLAYTDGLVEEHTTGGEQFGEERLIATIERVSPASATVQQMVRRLSPTLMQERGGITSDDATLFLIEWRGGTADHVTRTTPVTASLPPDRARPINGR